MSTLSQWFRVSTWVLGETPSSNWIGSADCFFIPDPDAPTPIIGAYLLHDKKGLKISKNKFDRAWQRMMGKALNKGLEIDGKILKLEEPFTFHYLKAKGVTDHTEHESGQRSKKAREIYVRRLQEMDATK